ncbi:MAG TPA: helix-turn-helix domain-containing protein [Rhodothermales bacterium]|nr:helix-turn-helix domain-containing protein [Rhodothermales bacterium]
MQSENNTPQRKAILDSLAQGATRTDAAHAAGISRRTLYTWMDQDPAFKQAVEDAEAETVDIAQGLAFRCAMQAQEDPRYLRALFFYLKCKAGWSDRPPRQERVTAELVKEIADEVIHTLQRLGLVPATPAHPESTTEPTPPEPAEKHVQSVQSVQQPTNPDPEPVGAQRAAPSSSNAAPSTAENVQSVQHPPTADPASSHKAHRKPKTKSKAPRTRNKQLSSQQADAQRGRAFRNRLYR